MQRIFGTRSVKTLKLFLVLLAGVLATSGTAYSTDLSVVPSAEELSTMSPIDVCRHFEVRETVPIKAAIASKGLKCGPILKNWAVLKEKQSIEDERQRKQSLEDERQRKLADHYEQQQASERDNQAFKRWLEERRLALERESLELERGKAQAEERLARALQSQSQAAGLAQALRGLQQLQGRTTQPDPRRNWTSFSCRTYGNRTDCDKD